MYSSARTADSRKAGLAIAFRLLASEKRWRRVSSPHRIALVKAGVEFPDGEAEVYQSEPALADLFTHTPSVFAVSGVCIHRV